MTAYGYKVPKVSHQQMATPGPMGGNTDIKMKNPPRVGPAHNPASNPDLQESFDSEKDFGTIARARKAIADIKSNPARYKAAMDAGLRLQNAGGPVNERGPDDHVTARSGSPARANNAYDKRPAPSKPNHGVKA